MTQRVDLHGIEALKLAAEYIDGDHAQTMLSTKAIPQNLEAPLGSKLIGVVKSIQTPYYLTTFNYYDGGNPTTPGNLLASRTFYYSDSRRCELVWAKEGAP